MFSLFKAKSFIDPEFGEFLKKGSSWKKKIKLQDGYETLLLIENSQTPSKEQLQIVRFLLKNQKKIFVECWQMILQNSDLPDVDVKKSGLFDNFKIYSVFIHNKNENIFWEIGFEPISFDAGGHIFNVQYEDDKCEGLTVDG